AATRETIIHRAVDRFLPKMQAVVNYAFRRGREELELPPDPREVSRAIYAAIMERMPPVLYEVAAAGAASALGELERRLVRSTLTRGREISERPDADSAVRGLSMRTLQDPPEVSLKVILNAQNKAAARWALEQAER